MKVALKTLMRCRTFFVLDAIDRGAAGSFEEIAQQLGGIVPAHNIPGILFSLCEHRALTKRIVVIPPSLRVPYETTVTHFRLTEAGRQTIDQLADPLGWNPKAKDFRLGRLC